MSTESEIDGFDLSRYWRTNLCICRERLLAGPMVNNDWLALWDTTEIMCLAKCNRGSKVFGEGSEST